MRKTSLEKVGVPISPVRTIPEAIQYGEQQGYDLLREVQHPKIGLYRAVRLPWKFQRSKATMRVAPPLMDQHRQAVLSLVKTIRQRQGAGNHD